MPGSSWAAWKHFRSSCCRKTARTRRVQKSQDQARGTCTWFWVRIFSLDFWSCSSPLSFEKTITDDTQAQSGEQRSIDNQPCFISHHVYAVNFWVLNNCSSWSQTCPIYPWCLVLPNIKMASQPACVDPQAKHILVDWRRGGLTVHWSTLVGFSWWDTYAFPEEASLDALVLNHNVGSRGQVMIHCKMEMWILGVEWNEIQLEWAKLEEILRWFEQVDTGLPQVFPLFLIPSKTVHQPFSDKTHCALCLRLFAVIRPFNDEGHVEAARGIMGGWMPKQILEYDELLNPPLEPPSDANSRHYKPSSFFPYLFFDKKVSRALNYTATSPGSSCKVPSPLQASSHNTKRQVDK